MADRRALSLSFFKKPCGRGREAERRDRHTERDETNGERKQISFKNWGENEPAMDWMQRVLEGPV